jgi:hypothetical protein
MGISTTPQVQTQSTVGFREIGSDKNTLSAGTTYAARGYEQAMKDSERHLHFRCERCDALTPDEDMQTLYDSGTDGLDEVVCPDCERRAR